MMCFMIVSISKGRMDDIWSLETILVEAVPGASIRHSGFANTTKVHLHDPTKKSSLNQQPTFKRLNNHVTDSRYRINPATHFVLRTTSAL